MQEHVTVQAPDDPGSHDISSLPRDLMEEVLGRVRLLALLLFIAFAFDPTLNLVAWAVVKLSGSPVPSEFSSYVGFALGDLAAAVASALLWWTAKRDSVPPSRLHTLGLIYQVIICFQISFSMMWQWYLQKGSVPPRPSPEKTQFRVHRPSSPRSKRWAGPTSMGGWTSTRWVVWPFGC